MPDELSVASWEAADMFEGDRGELNFRWDERSGEEKRDLGWIGCGAEGGVWVTYHPLAALYNRPEMDPLIPIVSLFTYGKREVSDRDRRKLSAFEVEALLEITSASNREVRRRAKSDGDTE